MVTRANPHLLVLTSVHGSALASTLAFIVFTPVHSRSHHPLLTNHALGFRACRVRVIFSLPSHLGHIYSGTLAYVELFTSFDKPISSAHQMSTLSADYQDGRRRSLVIPTDLLVMGCHLAPHFNRFKVAELGPHVDVLATSRRFFLNHYYNYHFFHYIRHWRRLGVTRDG